MRKRRTITLNKAEWVVAVCPYCYHNRILHDKESPWIGLEVDCWNEECNELFVVGDEIISFRIKVKGVTQ